VSAAAVPAAALVSAAFMATFAAAFMATFEAAFMAAFEAAVGAAVMEGSVEASIGEISVKEDAAVAVVTAVAVVIATVRPVICTAGCQRQTRNDQASNDRLAAVRRRPTREAAPARGGESRLKKCAFHH
jgi:hypothetical protein